MLNDGIRMAWNTLLAGAALGSALWAASLVAGPPDMVDVQDEFFGAGPREIFMLRSVTDNIASNTNAVTTVFLVAIDAVTATETLWPVHRSRFQPTDRPDRDSGAFEILTETLNGARDPFDVLTERRAMPSGAAAFFLSHRSDTLKLTEQAIAFQHSDGSKYALPAEVLFAGLGDLTANLSQEMEPYGRPGMSGIGDLLEGNDFSVEDCAVDQPSLIRFPAEMPPVSFTRVTCGELDNGMRLSVLRVIPPERLP